MGKNKKELAACNNAANNSKKTKTYFGSNYYNAPNYDKRGRKNKTKFPDFIKVCKPTQYTLKKFLIDELLKENYEVVCRDGFLYAKGTIPVLLTAHMDTVHMKSIEDFYEYYDETKNQHILSSPQGIGGDDRCGIYIILQIIKTHKCSVLFCEDEEKRGIGSGKFCKNTDLVKEISKLKYLIELDRMNNKDAVFYKCENEDFIDFIEKNTGYKTSWGTFSDISNLSPKSGVASVNLSCGYYNAHTTSEYVVVEEMMNTIEVVKKLLDVECTQFDYIEYYYGFYNNVHNNSYGNTYGNSIYGRSTYDADEDFYNQYYKHKEERSLVIIFDGKEYDNIFYVSNGASIQEAFGRFFIDNPSYSYDMVVDYEFYERKVYEDGWYSSKSVKK